MNRRDISRIVAGVLIVLIGAAIGLGSVQLWDGAPESWPDVVASNSAVKDTAKGMMAMALVLLVGGIAVLGNLGWGHIAAASAVAIFVAGAFWANYVLLGTVRPIHTGTNVVVGVAILWLLWVGYSKRGA